MEDEKKTTGINPELVYLLQDTVTTGVNERCEKGGRKYRNAASISR